MTELRHGPVDRLITWAVVHPVAVIGGLILLTLILALISVNA